MSAGTLYLGAQKTSSYFADIAPAGSLQVPDFELPPVQVSLVEQGCQGELGLGDLERSSSS